LGYTPVTYAGMLLRLDDNSMSVRDALQVVADAAHNYCPKHITDLPAGWQ
jgi:hypothetical protein